MANRENISKKVRFEVFKRDKFTCQYCGRQAPDVVLEVDHIQPVAKGGTNDFLNLITSCFDCNRGKGKRTLTQQEELKKQQKMLKELSERKEQLEMLVEWKKGLDNLEEEMLGKIEELLKKTGYGLSEQGKLDFKKLLKKYGFAEVYECTNISISQYYTPGDEESINKTFDYVERICAVRKRSTNNPNLYDINYLCKMARNNFSPSIDCKVRQILNYNYEKDDFDTVKDIIRNAYNKYRLIEDLNYYYGVD